MSDSPVIRRCLTTLTLLAASFGPAIAQDADEADETHWWESIAAIHLEQPNDTWAPGTGVSDRNGPSIVKFGRFTSVQANVDATGANIVGDAANEPTIAVSPTQPHQIVIGWRQFDTIDSDFRQAGWAFSHDAGATWTFPGVLDPGVFRSDPVVACDAHGQFHYLSLTIDFTTWMFTSNDGGRTWSDPVFAVGGDKPWFAIDRSDGPSRGRMYQAWSIVGNSRKRRIFNWSLDGGVSWSEPVEIPLAPRWGNLCVDRWGKLYLAGYVFQDSESAFVAVSKQFSRPDPNPPVSPVLDHYSRVNLGGIVQYREAPNPGGLLGQIWIGVDISDGPNADDVYLLATLNPPGGDPGDVLFARSDNGGESWSPPIRVNDDPEGSLARQWFGTMSVAPNGRIDVAWIDQRNRSGDLNAQVFYSHSEDGGRTWAANVPVTPQFDSHVGWPHQNKIGDYYHMESENRGAHLAYAATFNGEQDVYYLFIESPECRADLDGSGDVDLGDLTLLLTAFAVDGGGDLDGDGITGLTDLTEMLSLFGEACG